VRSPIQRQGTMTSRPLAYREVVSVTLVQRPVFGSLFSSAGLPPGRVRQRSRGQPRTSGRFASRGAPDRATLKDHRLLKGLISRPLLQQKTESSIDNFFVMNATTDFLRLGKHELENLSVRHTINLMNFAKIGRIGGRSKSSAKRSASRANGVSGGRPSTRPLIERLLRRPVKRAQSRQVFSLLQQLTPSERRGLCEMLPLGVLPVWHQSVEIFLEWAWERLSRPVRFNERKLNREQRFILAKFRLAARYNLPRS
jgi:hypothetical protein